MSSKKDSKKAKRGRDSESPPPVEEGTISLLKYINKAVIAKLTLKLLTLL